MGKGMPYLEGAMYAILALIIIIKFAVGHEAFMGFILGDGAKTKKEPIHRRSAERNI